MAHIGRIARTDNRDWQCPFCHEINPRGFKGKRCGNCDAYFFMCAGAGIAILRDTKILWGSDTIEYLKNKLAKEIEAVRNKEKSYDDVGPIEG